MILRDLWIYPIKSCRGIKLGEAKVIPQGLVGDRTLMLVDHRGKFVSQRTYPQLARVKVDWLEDGLILSELDPNLGIIGQQFLFQPSLKGEEIAVEIWRDRTIAIDQGDQVSRWFHQVLNLDQNQQIRLVKQSPAHLRAIDSNYAIQRDQPVSFADGYPLLLTNKASLQDLNHRLQQVYPQSDIEIPMNRFRPNLVIDTDQPFVEDQWRQIRIGSVKFASVKPCSRCVVITVDQTTGTRDSQQEPLRTLQTFRQFSNQQIMFGMNLIPLNIGTIKSGDLVKILD